MPYAPTVNDRSGEILGAYTAKAAETRAEGMANFGQSIGEGLKSMGSSIAGGITKAAENRIASDGVNAKFDMLKGMKKSNGQLLFSQDIIDKFDTMPLGKRQGIVSTADSIMDHDLKQWMYGVQYNAQRDRVNAQTLAQQPAANQVPINTNTAPAAQPQANPAPAPAQDWRSMVPKR